MTGSCAHHRCSCQIREQVRYCSEYCRSAADGAAVTPEALDMAVCLCGHAACASHHHKHTPVHGTRPIANPNEEATC